MFFVKLLLVVIALSSAQGYALKDGFSNVGLSRKIRSIIVDVFDEDPIELLEDIPLRRVKRDEVAEEKSEDGKIEDKENLEGETTDEIEPLTTDVPEDKNSTNAAPDSIKIPTNLTNISVDTTSSLPDTDVSDDKNSTNAAIDSVNIPSDLKNSSLDTTSSVPDTTSSDTSPDNIISLSVTTESHSEILSNDTSSVSSIELASDMPSSELTTEKSISHKPSSTLPPLSTPTGKGKPAVNPTVQPKKSGAPDIHMPKYLSIIVSILIAKSLI